MDNVIEILQKRGLIEAITSEDVKQAAERPLKVYCGFDPTADSLHLGNMVALMGLSWTYSRGACRWSYWYGRRPFREK